MKTTSTTTSESVSEGHPDKVCDYIADSVVDAHLAGDSNSHVACEVLCKRNLVVVAGEISSAAEVDYERLVRGAIREIGYTDASEPFCADTVQILLALTRQSSEIGGAVDRDRLDVSAQGAGDQGIMFGYATEETPELMPLPIVLAHALTRGLADDRRAGVVDWLLPDAKAQVSVVYEDGRPHHVSHIVVSTQHRPGLTAADIHDYVTRTLGPRVLGRWCDSSITFLVNPSGSFVEGGPSADCGVTGRKIIVDSYGGVGRHGGGAFSGKDPSKVDRSGAYFCRYVARALVAAGLAQRAELQVSYAIGQAAPVSVRVETFGTGDEATATRFVERFDFRPGQIIRELDLLRPIYRQTTNYGHFGRPGLPWEDADGNEPGQRAAEMQFGRAGANAGDAAAQVNSGWMYIMSDDEPRVCVTKVGADPHRLNGGAPTSLRRISAQPGFYEHMGDIFAVYRPVAGDLDPTRSEADKLQSAYLKVVGPGVPQCDV